MAATQLSPEAATQFQEGINLVLLRWTALQMAVDHNSGGPHSSRIPPLLSQSLFSLITKSKEKIYRDNVVHMLGHYMDLLRTDFEDGGIEFKEVAVKLLTMHEECLEGNFNSIKSLKANPPRWVPSCIPQDDSDDDDNGNMTDEIVSDDDSSAMVVDAPETGSRDFQVDSIDSPQTDDGWTVVGGSRRNRGRRN
ncbi:hypothetical protein Leryth_018201 [Lithospermum erythrorhizon]|nr:hypothetical protein Leryth_018201 [Lithospermum erythrorhizon]